MNISLYILYRGYHLSSTTNKTTAKCSLLPNQAPLALRSRGGPSLGGSGALGHHISEATLSPLHGRVAGRAQSTGAQQTTRPGSEQQRRLQKPSPRAFCVFTSRSEKQGFRQSLGDLDAGDLQIRVSRVYLLRAETRPQRPAEAQSPVAQDMPACGNRVPADVICWEQSHQGGPRSERTGVLRRRQPGETPTGRGPVKTEAET